MGVCSAITPSSSKPSAAFVIGDDNVTNSDGYAVADGQSIELHVQGDDIWAVAETGSAIAGVLIYSS